MSSIILVSVDGVPGSGKSRRMEAIYHRLEQNDDAFVRLIEEPVEDFVKSGLLELYYQDRVRWGLTFQIFAATVRLKKLREAIERYEKEAATKTLVLLSERCLSTDQIFLKTLFKRGEVTETEYRTYQSWCDEWLKVEITRTIELKHVYLKCAIETSMKRIKERGRPAERNYDQFYQHDLMQGHDIFFSNKLNVQEIDGNIDVETVDFQEQLTAVNRFVFL
jgi:deoxyadenosine/deoxycytidine kinase